MKFELNGREYHTVTRTVTFEELHTEGRNGEDMFIATPDLPTFPSLTEIVEYMERKGAKVVSE